MLTLAAIAVLTLFACNDKYPDLEDGLYAEIITNHGTMVTQLYYQDAPATVASFVSLAEGTSTMVDSTYAGKPFYNGLTFHRILKDFMIQGGDPKGTGQGDPGYKFHDEINKNLHTEKGMLSMANSGPNTNGSQFFITHKETPWLDKKHTVFGKVVIGLDVIDTIANVEMGNARAGKPKDKVIMQEVNIIRKGRDAKSFDAPTVFEEQLRIEEERKAKAEAALKEKYKAVVAKFDAKRAKAKKLPSGLEVFWDNKSGNRKPKLESKVMVDYAGYFNHGELFDTNIEAVAKANDKYDHRRGDAGMYKPMERPYSKNAGLIPGFTEGMLLLAPGDKVTLFIPAHLGYGERGYPGAIPPNSDLVFEVTLVETKK